ncbi:dCTP deaminase [Candidatus Bathyarchaeota archaeon]|nr:MAG: dCTP deaminase [Candidatus Bathyarchaeota archaeon]
MILSDFDLNNYIRKKRLVIKPLRPDVIRENGIDLHLGRRIARLKQTEKVMDTRKNFQPEDFYKTEYGKEFTLKPHEKVLVYTLEYMEVPVDLVGFVELRSTFARCGLSLPPTIVDGGFKGNLTLEIAGSSFPIKLYAEDRFAHVVFAKLTSPLEKPYSGKYQNQRGVTFPKFDLQK